ncbi:hypothetical protein cyc_06752 [Cyclospora cayetanensis]|uniref:Uncharacterized protein n=1 Tax=Cyclospora cayetanensis TaxID=88456 RepID=A0A1D3CS65_9EIME|nr:hypothetical protein cyc_06752 [Cyclospora cayetanensis]
MSVQMEIDAQRRQIEVLSQQQQAEQGAAIVAATHEPTNEQLEQLQALEEENIELRHQLADLSAALCTPASVKDGASSMNTLLASQLRTAHADITKLRNLVRHQLRSAGLAQDSVGQAMKTIGKGGEVFATDPNDITVQEAALDSMLARGRRRVLAAREFVWSAVATLKDLIDQTFERMGRLVKSEVSVGQKSAYVQELQGLVTSQLDPALKIYNDLDEVHKELDTLKAVVFDPKRNNPYCPCRPRRMVLEDDLEHLQRQLREANEALRTVRAQLVKLEMENLANYVQVQNLTVMLEKPFEEREEGKEEGGGMGRRCRLGKKLSVCAWYMSTTNPQDKCSSPSRHLDQGAQSPLELQNQQQPQLSPTAARKAADESEESMEELLMRAQKEHDAAKVAEALAALKDEVEMLKDRAMLDEVHRAQPAGYLADELFNQGAAVAKMINQMVESTEHLAQALTANPAAEAARQRFLMSAHDLQHVAKEVVGGRLPAGVAVKRVAETLKSLRLEEIQGIIDPQDRKLLQMIEEQAVKMRRINIDMHHIANLHTACLLVSLAPIWLYKVGALVVEAEAVLLADEGLFKLAADKL